jgi:hypothetical protein
MQNSVLINALFRLTEETTPGADASLTVAVAIAMVSTFGVLYMMHGLLGYNKLTAMSAFLLGIPYILLCGVGIFGSLLISTFMSAGNQSLTERAGVLPLFESTELFYEVSVLCGIFFAVCVWYIVFTHRRSENRRTPKTWFAAVAFSCGFEIVAAVGLLTVSILRFAGAELPLSHSFVGRLFFYAVAIVLLKLSEQIFVLVYTELFGINRLDAAIARMQDAEPADLRTLKRLARRQCGFTAPPALALLIWAAFRWAEWHAGMFGPSGTVAALRESGVLLAAPFVLLLLGILIARSVWLLLPGTHPLLRRISRLRFADEAAAQLIREYGRPLFVDGNTRVTPHFFIKESVSTRVHYRPNLVGIGVTVCGLGTAITTRRYVLRFSDGSRLVVAPDQRELFLYARRILAEAGGEIETAPRRRSLLKAVAVLLIPLSAAALITYVMRIQFDAEAEATDHAYFKAHIAQYEEAAQTVAAGTADMTDAASAPAPLPEEYAALSKGGKVLVRVNEDGRDVIFFMRIGVLGDFEGYSFTNGEWYRASDLNPHIQRISA